MLSFLPAFVLFPLNVLLQCLNLAWWGAWVITLGILKLLLPFAPVTRVLTWLLNFGMNGFGVCSIALVKLSNTVEWDYRVDGELKKDGWYLIIANHLSWLDIMILADFVVGRIPATKFFLKKELLWMPFVGLGAWALDMPFMHRYSREFIRKNPHLKGKDILATQRSCEKFKRQPTTVINFVEGTRFTQEKHDKKQSPFQNLLAPKAGGIAFTLAAMGNMFTNIIDVTIAYPGSYKHIMFDMLCGRLKKVTVIARVLPVEKQLIGDYFDDDAFKGHFQQWLNRLWEYKDTQLTTIKAQKKQG